MRRRPGTLGWAALGVYVVACVVTIRSTSHHVRPLFDESSPVPHYRWVAPPPELAATNVPPKPSSTEIPLGPGGSSPSQVSSEDGQFVLDLPAGFVPPRPPDTAVRVDVVPLDPAGLGPLPKDLRPDGNAYRLELTYRPSGEPVPPPAVTLPAGLALRPPHLALGVLVSPDGRSWRPLEAARPSTNVFVRPGYFLAVIGASSAVRTLPSFGDGDGGTVRRVLVVGAVTVGAALALWLLPLLFRRRRGDGGSPPVTGSGG